MPTPHFGLYCALEWTYCRSLELQMKKGIEEMLESAKDQHSVLEVSVPSCIISKPQSDANWYATRMQ